MRNIIILQATDAFILRCPDTTIDYTVESTPLLLRGITMVMLHRHCSFCLLLSGEKLVVWAASIRVLLLGSTLVSLPFSFRRRRGWRWGNLLGELCESCHGLLHARLELSVQLSFASTCMSDYISFLKQSPVFQFPGNLEALPAHDHKLLCKHKKKRVKNFLLLLGYHWVMISWLLGGFWSL